MYAGKLNLTEVEKLVTNIGIRKEFLQNYTIKVKKNLNTKLKKTTNKEGKSIINKIKQVVEILKLSMHTKT